MGGKIDSCSPVNSEDGYRLIRTNVCQPFPSSQFTASFSSACPALAQTEVLISCEAQAAGDREGAKGPKFLHLEILECAEEIQLLPRGPRSS